MKVVDLSQIIRPLKERQARPRRRESFEPASLGRLAVLEEAEALVAGCLAELSREMPELQPTRRLYDGAWYLGVRTAIPRATRRPSTSTTRFEVSLRLDPAGRELDVRTHATVLDEELGGESVTVPLDDEGKERLREAVEQAALVFAGRYVERTARLAREGGTQTSA